MFLKCILTINFYLFILCKKKINKNKSREMGGGVGASRGRGGRLPWPMTINILN